MGIVFRAHDVVLDRPLALKLSLDAEGVREASDQAAPSSSALRRFVAEARITGGLDHPGIVPVHSFGRDPTGRYYFAMRLVEGRTFADVIAEVHRAGGTTTLARALGHLLRVCETMAFAHARGVIHRDLKPANVMVGRFGEVYVMDWGVARSRRVAADRGAAANRDVAAESHATSIDATAPRTSAGDARSANAAGARSAASQPFDPPSATLEGSVLGTPSYMPPEQASGHTSDLDERSDVYSVGAILYHLLAGHAPFTEPGSDVSSPRSLLLRVVEGPPPPLARLARDLPVELVAICDKAMARDPALRYPSMTVLAEDLRAHLEQRVVRAHRTGPWIELQKWIRRNRGLAVAAAIALLAVTGGSTAVAWITTAKNARLGIQAAALSNARQETQEKLDEYRRMADVKLAAELVADAAHLWPRRARMRGAFEQWLARARDLHVRGPMHVRALDALQTGSADSEADWKRQVMTALVADLRRLFEPDTGLLATVERRLELALRLERVTVEEHAEEWRRVIADVARPDGLYRGFQLAPITGLVPLEPDPRSGVWEFWQYESGDRPERDATTGAWKIVDGTGIVLVLLPGGETWIGSSSQAGEKNFVTQMSEGEFPVHCIDLAPFLFSKYEMTQGQWSRLMGSNPSALRADLGGPAAEFIDRERPLAHPVESVSWKDAVDAAARLELLLPTEAQWEYACRAGNEKPWYFGEREGLARQYENLADASYDKQFITDIHVCPWRDGFAGHAPVGSFLPNAFGLHDLLGNVREWCRDRFVPYDLHPPPRPDGLIGDETSPTFIVRGGGFDVAGPRTRSAYRSQLAPENQANSLGLRLALNPVQ